MLAILAKLICCEPENAGSCTQKRCSQPSLRRAGGCNDNVYSTLLLSQFRPIQTRTRTQSIDQIHASQDASMTNESSASAYTVVRSATFPGLRAHGGEKRWNRHPRKAGEQLRRAGSLLSPESPRPSVIRVCKKRNKTRSLRLSIFQH